MTDLLPRLTQALADRYVLVRELGGGGMARVWLARETALGRDVVIKIVGDGTGLSAERFAREVQLAARLQQANIVPLLTAGDAEGVPFYTMPYVDGQSLRVRLTRGVPGLSEALDILRDVARALAYAHGQGVIHRDIKPENILLSSGVAVVTDFGIAKALSAARTIDRVEGVATSSGATLTQAGMSLGTPAYMAPEQALGEEADARADLYAWGIVAYELLAGRHPFAHHSTPSKIVAAHLAEVPAPLPPTIPTALAALVAQCLAKDPSERPASAALLVTQLSAVTSVAASSVAATSVADAPAAATVGTAASRRPWMFALAVPLLAVAGWLAMRAGGSSPTATPATVSAAGAAPASTDSANTAPQGSIAVLPFVNLSGDPKDEYFSDGMTDELAHALQNLPGLLLAGRSSSYAFKGKNVPAAEVGRTLGVRTLVEGTVRRSGTRVRIAAQLTNTVDGRVLWSDVFENAGGDVFAVQDTFTRAIVAQLAPMLATGAVDGGSARPASVEQRGTSDAVAYDLYLRGRYLWARRGAVELDSALTLFRQALARDPRFARGWAGLALTHVLRPNYDVLAPVRPSFDSAQVDASRALAIDSTLADAWAARGLARLRVLDFAGGGEALARARVLEPRNPTVHHWSAFWYSSRGDLAQATRERDLALALDPLSASILNNQVIALIDQRRWAEMAREAARVHAMSPLFEVSTKFTFLPAGAILSGEAESLYQQQQQILRDPARRAIMRSARSTWAGRLQLAAATGRWPEARALRDTIERGGGGTVLMWDRAHAALIFGTRAQAAALFVESFEREGAYGNLSFSPCTPILDLIRDEPTWQTWSAKHELPTCPYRSTWPELRAPENRR